jgi:hypothetical protein
VRLPVRAGADGGPGDVLLSRAGSIVDRIVKA